MQIRFVSLVSCVFRVHFCPGLDFIDNNTGTRSLEFSFRIRLRWRVENRVATFGEYIYNIFTKKHKLCIELQFLNHV